MKFTLSIKGTDFITSVTSFLIKSPIKSAIKGVIILILLMNSTFWINGVVTMPPLITSTSSLTAAGESISEVTSTFSKKDWGLSIIVMISCIKTVSLINSTLSI